MPEPELLKQPEQKEETNNEELIPSPIQIDSTRIEVLTKLRLEKLAAVKPFISLKLHDQILSRLIKESSDLRQQLQDKKVAVAKQNREQSLSKVFFEQGFLKIKTIRID